MYSIVRKYKTTGKIGNLAGRGPKMKTTTKEDAAIMRKVKKNPHLSAPLICRIKNYLGIDVHAKTIRNRLNSKGLNGQIAKKKPRTKGNDWGGLGLGSTGPWTTKRSFVQRWNQNTPLWFRWSDPSVKKVRRKFKKAVSQAKSETWWRYVLDASTNVTYVGLNFNCSAGRLMVWGSMS